VGGDREAVDWHVSDQTWISSQKLKKTNFVGSYLVYFSY